MNTALVTVERSSDSYPEWEPIDRLVVVEVVHQMWAIVLCIEYDLAEVEWAAAMAKLVIDIDIDLMAFDLHAFDRRVCKSDNCILAVELLRVGKYRI